MPIRNPDFPQSPRLPLDKEKLRIPTKLRKKRFIDTISGKMCIFVAKTKNQDHNEETVFIGYAARPLINKVEMLKMC